MNSLSLNELNQRFGLNGQIQFAANAAGLIYCDIENEHASAQIFLQGGHLTRWTPKGQQPVIWLSEAAKFIPGKAIRGGIPVCWPWFGEHPSQKEFPAHGFARTGIWEVLETSVGSSGETCITLALTTRKPEIWPYAAGLTLRLNIGTTLQLELISQNLGAEACEISSALHAYFQVSDSAQIQVLGLENQTYLDKLDGAAKHQRGPIVIEGELDRVYQDQGGDCLILDSGLKRRIRISKQGSYSTVVWNPGAEKSARLGDMGVEGYRGMVCVESANTGQDSRTLQANRAHSLKVCYQVEPFSE